MKEKLLALFAKRALHCLFMVLFTLLFVVNSYSQSPCTPKNFEGQQLNVHPQNPCDVISCPEQAIEKADFNILFDMGDDYDLGNCSFTADISVQVIVYDINGNQVVSPPFSSTHIVNMNIDNNKPEQLYSVPFTSIYDQVSLIETIVLSVNIPSNNCFAQNYFRLKPSYTEKFRTGVSSVTPIVSTNTVNPNANPVTFSWSISHICPQITNYQFQLLRLYNDATLSSTKLNPGSISDIEAKVDWNQALTIETQNSYPNPGIKLTVAEGEGHYIWRVRPIGNFYTGGIANHLNWGVWSAAPDTGDVVTDEFLSGKTYAFFYDKPDHDINWIYSRTFTEGNSENNKDFRVSEQITYANGLQQVRQTQTHVQSQNAVLTSQTVQDFSGRPAITTMAAPLQSQNYLEYKKNYIKNGSGGTSTAYAAPDFDATANYNNPTAIGSGNLADYYSQVNGDVTVPDAQGYPFTRILYSTDGTNRVIEQGGVGPVHRIGASILGDDRTTKTFYGGASETELIRIFGDEAPKSNSVYKSVNVDENKVATISYISKEGQTIATALSFDGNHNVFNGTPGNTNLLDGLPSQTSFQVSDAINDNTPISQYTFSSSKPITVTNIPNTICTLSYTITPETIQDDCPALCKSCDYNVKFFIKNVNDPATIISLTPSELIAAPVACTSNTALTYTVTATLPPGIYLIEKQVTGYTENTGTEKLYVDEYTDAAKIYLQNSFNTAMVDLYDALDDNDPVTFYNVLQTDFGATINSTTTSVDIDPTGGSGCCNVTIPIDYCNVDECTTMVDDANGNIDFEQILFDKWSVASGNPEGIVYGSTLNHYFFAGGRSMYHPKAIATIDLTQFSSLFIDGYKIKNISITGLTGPYGNVDIFDDFPGETSGSIIESEIELGKQNHHFSATYSGGIITINAEIGSGALPSSVVEITFNDNCSGCLSLPSNYSPYKINFSSTGVKFTNGGNGAFNAMIQHMIEETAPPAEMPYNCNKLLNCWRGLVNSYKNLSTKADGSRNYDFNLMDAFLECAGKKYVGVANHPYGNCTGTCTGEGPFSSTFNTGYGFLEYAYKTFRYDETNRSAQCEQLIVDLACTNTFQALNPGTCTGLTSTSPVTFTGGLPSGIVTTWPWNESDLLYPSDDNGNFRIWHTFNNCVTSTNQTVGFVSTTQLEGCTFADPLNPTQEETILCLKQKSESACTDACESRFNSFVTQLITLYHENGYFITGHDPGNSDLPKISIEDIYCAAENLVENCKRYCELTPELNPAPPDLPYVGTAAQILAMTKAMTYSFSLSLPIDGKCADPVNYEFVSGSPGADKKDLVIQYLNNKLEEFRATLSGTSGAYLDIYNLLNLFDPALLAACGINPGLSVFVHPDRPSRFLVKPCSSLPQDDTGDSEKRLGGPDPVPLPIEVFTICFGQSQTLTAPSGVSWLWSTGETTQSISITPSSIGSATYFVVTETSGGITSSTYYSITAADCNQDGSCCLIYEEDPIHKRVAATQQPVEIQPGQERKAVSFDKSFDIAPEVKIVSASKESHIENITKDGFEIVTDNTTSSAGVEAMVEIKEAEPELLKAVVHEGELSREVNLMMALESDPKVRIMEADGPCAVAGVCKDKLTLISSDKEGREATLDICEERMESGMAVIEDGQSVKRVEFARAFAGQPIVKMISAEGGSCSVCNVNRTGFDLMASDDAGREVSFTVESACNKKKTVICTNVCGLRRCPDICFKWEQVYIDPTEVITISPVSCEKELSSYLRDVIEAQLAACIDNQVQSLRNLYTSTCLDGTFDENFTVNYELGIHHYTLYYYDRKGNLVKTIPPRGIVTNTTSRASHPAHSLISEYAYNSLGQATRQKTPDGGETYFVYDKKGQLRFSQNAKQKTAGEYSYTRYDELGRVIEVGLSSLEAVSGVIPDFSVLSNYADFEETAHNDPGFPQQTVGNTNKEITVTDYSIPSGVNYNPVSTINFPQRFLQNRVSHTFTDEDGDFSTTADKVNTYFSYDPHGNVEWLVQDIPELGKKYIRYEYDLVSNKVLKVFLNEKEADQFTHRYIYDEDNRIVQVETSRDGKIWERDGRYNYYAHGPLKRTLTGEDKVQGLDNVYTIQGWLKAINHSALSLLSYPGSESGNVGRDAWGMMLTYYHGDFNRTNSPFNSLFNNYQLVPASPLFNGNITSWTSNIDYAALPDQSLIANNQYKQMSGEIFRYDELNRIKKSEFKAFNGTAWPATANDDYFSQYSYDANGNILTLMRNGYGTNANQRKMDFFTYIYSGTSANRLTQVIDFFDNSDPTRYSDLRHQSNPFNYTYDAIGNIISNAQENRTIQWNVYGKVKRVNFNGNGNSKDHLRYLYDAQGNRVREKYFTPIQVSSNNSDKTAYYVRDAQGNTMAVYWREKKGTKYEYSLREIPIYGSARIGEYKPQNFVVKTEDIPGECTGCPGSRSMLITETLYDSPHTKNNVTNPSQENNFGELVVLRNVSDKEISLENVELRNKESNQKVMFTANEKLQPEQSMVVAYGNENQKQELMTTNKLEAQITNDQNLKWHWQTEMKLKDSQAQLELVYKESTGQDRLIDELKYDNINLKARNDYVADMNDPSREKPNSLQREFFDPLAESFDPSEFKKDKVKIDVKPTIITAKKSSDIYTRQLDRKLYELADHLGNVRVVVGDRKLSTINAGIPQNFTADIKAFNNYYAFGMKMPARNFNLQTGLDNNTGYRYGYNGKESDFGWYKQDGTVYDYGFRIFDARLGRFLSVDPLFRSYPELTSYQFASNTPIAAVDLDGLEAKYVIHYATNNTPLVAYHKDVVPGGETHGKRGTGTLHFYLDKKGKTYYSVYDKSLSDVLNDFGKILFNVFGPDKSPGPGEKLDQKPVGIHDLPIDPWSGSQEPNLGEGDVPTDNEEGKDYNQQSTKRDENNNPKEKDHVYSPVVTDKGDTIGIVKEKVGDEKNKNKFVKEYKKGDPDFPKAKEELKKQTP